MKPIILVLSVAAAFFVMTHHAHAVPDAGFTVTTTDAGVASTDTEADKASADLAGPQTDGEAIGAVAKLVNAVKDGNWRLALALLLGLLVYLTTRLKLRKRVKYFDGDRGGALYVMLLGQAAAFATVLATPTKLTAGLILGTVGLVFTAVGGYTWVKRVLWPKDAVEHSEGE